MTKITRNCDTCKKEVLRYKSQIRGERFYCSHKCRHEGQRKYFTGNDNPNYRHGVHCEDSLCVCGKVKDYRALQCNSCFENVNKYFQDGTIKRNNILWRYIETYRLLHYENCLLCGQGEMWNGKKLVLQLDHIDGNPTNNLLSNLRVLCPNCHSQTDTYASKNRKKK